MKRLFAISSASAVAALWTSPAAADPAYDGCIDRTTTNAGWAECGQTYLGRLDAALNIAWKKAIGSILDPMARADLLAEQRAWLKFRDASCRIYANGHFGREGQVLHFTSCRAAIVRARISDLNGLAEHGR